MLRKKIERVIELASSPEEAAVFVCYLLEIQMSAAGCSWFTDDPEVGPFLTCEEEDPEKQKIFDMIEGLFPDTELERAAQDTAAKSAFLE